MFRCRQSKLNNFSEGFTLAEVLVTISLSLVLFGALYGIYITSYRSYQRSAAKAEANQNGRITLERISRDLRQTPIVTTILPPTADDLLNPPSTSLQFQDGHDILQTQYIEYSLADKKLHRKLLHYCFSASPSDCDPSDWVAWNAIDANGDPPSIAIDEDVVKADLITTLGFYGSSKISIEITTQDKLGNESHFKTDIFCRNL